MVRLPELPPGYVACVWCQTATKRPNGDERTRCPKCGLDPMPGEDPTKNGKVNPTQAKRATRNRTQAARTTRLSTKPKGEPIMGVDPGARYTGVVVRDGDVVLHASTLVRHPDMTATDWAITVVTELHKIRKDFPATLPMAVEGVSDPKGFQNGKRAAINPKDIIRAGIVLGAVVATWPTAIVIKPGGNGSQHYTNYPAVLIGRRDPDLPGSTNGAGTRDHEQSAYDVAGKGAREIYKPRLGPLLG